MGATMRVEVNVRLLALEIARSGKRFVTVRDIERRLAVSSITAGKILARMESMGLARRFSGRAYEIVIANAKPPVNSQGRVGHENPE